MLRELHISNLAVIADARIELSAGLNCFTGATGAGKSLVIGAIEVLLGLRSAAEMLRPGADEGRVSGLFQVSDPQTLARIERAADLPLGDDAGEILLTRRLHASGRTGVSLNGNPITLGMLRALGEHLVDVHGQHDHQYLLKPGNQLEVLDQFGGLGAIRGRYHDVYERLSVARRSLEELSAGRMLRQQQLELYHFQIDEIDRAQLDEAEYQELQARSTVLRNLGKLKKDASATHAALYEMDGSVLERLKMMSAVLGELSGLDSNLSDVAGGVRDATIALEEAAFDLSRYLDKLDLDPAEQAEVDERLNTVNRVLAKYAGDIPHTLALRADLGRQVADLEKQSDDLSSVQGLVEPLSAQLRELGAELSAARRKAGSRLAPLVEEALAELGMEKARFTVELAAVDEPQPSGMDVLELIVQTNPGQLAQPLRRIASGGELSRIMLALKGILARGDRVSVLVFDEIDANVGGRLGAVIGRKLRDLARHNQVLCITHLPQIACYAERHLTVRKTVAADDAQTSVRAVGGAERIEELSEMIGGPRVTETTRAQARELLEAAQAPVSPHPRTETRAQPAARPRRSARRA